MFCVLQGFERILRVHFMIYCQLMCNDPSSCLQTPLSHSWRFHLLCTVFVSLGPQLRRVKQLTSVFARALAAFRKGILTWPLYSRAYGASQSQRVKKPWIVSNFLVMNFSHFLHFWTLRAFFGYFIGKGIFDFPLHYPLIISWF